MNELTKIHITEDEKKSAVMSALRVTMSPHEWTWTDREQVEMAQYILWQSTRIAVLEKILEAVKLFATRFGHTEECCFESEEDERGE